VVGRDVLDPWLRRGWRRAQSTDGQPIRFAAGTLQLKFDGRPDGHIIVYMQIDLAVRLDGNIYTRN